MKNIFSYFLPDSDASRSHVVAGAVPAVIVVTQLVSAVSVLLAAVV